MTRAQILKNALDDPTKNQYNKVLHHIWTQERIGPVVAMQRLFVYRLAAVIHVLNKEDFYIMNVNPHGETALYVMNNVTRRELEQELRDLEVTV